jgi:hypothetical protein
MPGIPALLDATDRSNDSFSLMKNRLNKLTSFLRSRLYTDAAGLDSTVFLLSSGRSGSTWLTRMLESLPSTRTIFEPFHAKRGYQALAPYRYRYLPPDETDRVLRDTLADVLSGRQRSVWSDQFNPLRPATYRRRLVKEVRINVLAPWLTRAFPEARFLFLVRHPIPLALSQLKGGWALSSRRLYQQSELADHYDLHKLNEFGWPTNGFESLVLFWAVENLVARQCAEQSGSMLVRYEDLVLHPQRSLEGIERHIGAELPSSARHRFSETSWSSRKGVGDMSLAEKVDRWQRSATASQIEFVGRVLSVCELDTLYSPDTAGGG